MAKKINFKAGVDVSQIVNTLKKEKIEHVRVIYPKSDKHPKRDYIVVKTVYLDAVRKACDATIGKVKNARHYENLCILHAKNYFEPQFECTCRNCGKKFMHRVKEAVWCSDKCHKEFRLKKKQSA